MLELNREQLLELTSKGYTQKQMAAYFKVSRATLQRNLRRKGISTPNHHNSLKFDNTVFDNIDTEEKAYWLGFLYADGSVTSKLNNVELSLSVTDLDHLVKYKEFLKAESEIKIEDSNFNGKVFQRCRLIVTNKHFKERLIELGCTPNKSLNLKFPLNIFKEDSLKYHFIRGYIDGDGCISLTKTLRIVLSIVGTKEFLSEIISLFPEFGELHKDSRWKNNTYYISCSFSKADKVLTKLYKNSTVYLLRKYSRLAVLSSNW